MKRRGDEKVEQAKRSAKKPAKLEKGARISKESISSTVRSKKGK